MFIFKFGVFLEECQCNLVGDPFRICFLCSSKKARFNSNKFQLDLFHLSLTFFPPIFIFLIHIVLIRYAWGLMCSEIFCKHYGTAFSYPQSLPYLARSVLYICFSRISSMFFSLNCVLYWIFSPIVRFYQGSSDLHFSLYIEGTCRW